MRIGRAGPSVRGAGHARHGTGTPAIYYSGVATSQVTVAKESLRFSAAHFLTLPGHVCERLHGHNYRVAVTVDGPVDPSTGFVVDFAVLKRVVQAVIEPLDHRVLVPSANPSLRTREADGQMVVDYGRPGWLVVPAAHACLLPVAQTTAELLAEWMAAKVWTVLRAEGGSGLTRLLLELEESAGQAARTELRT
jgi:6-pyruvoyltetrahydropterin/6-carboxytetrahydropterin synthase